MAIILPVYGNWEDTLECLQDLARQDQPAFLVLVADDGSPDRPPPEVHTFRFAEYLRGENRGFAGNCNRAAAVAVERGATHLLFLNNDTTYSAGFNHGWQEAIARHPDAILSPLIYWFKKPRRVWLSGGRASILLPYMRPASEYRADTAVEVVCGCAMVVPVEAWRRLGGFDERFVTYYEDYDFLMRARAAGYRAYVVPDAELRVWHKVSGSFRGQGAWRQQYRMLTSRLLFIRTHYRGLRKAACLALAALHLTLEVVLKLPERPDGGRLRESIAAGLGR